MNKEEVITGLESFKERLSGEIIEAFETRGRSFGDDRFTTWRRKFSNFLDEYLPGESSTLNAKLTHYVYVAHTGESDVQRFWRVDGESMLSYIDSLILDVNNDEYDFKEELASSPVQNQKDETPKNKVFIVHGHAEDSKEKTARFIENLGFEAIILHEQASRSRTIIEKIEDYSNDVGFGIVLYTPDDMGNVKDQAEDGTLKYRARQNVVFEHGFLMGKIGRENVIPLVEGNVELPNDISGIVYVSDKDWQIDIAKEMSDAGYEIDFNKLYKKS